MSDSDVPDHHGAFAEAGGEYPNETIRLLFERGSCRDYSDRKVSEEVLRTVLEAGTHAPTGGNLQPYSIIKIGDEGSRRWFVEIGLQKFIGEAPVLLLFCIDFRRLRRWAELEVAPFTATSAFRHFWISFQDTIMSAQNICTAADAMGLGSCYIGTVQEIVPEIREKFNLPEGVYPVVLLCMGYPKTRILPRKKLGVDVVVHDELYQELDDRALLEAYSEKYSGPRDSRRLEITEKRLETIRQVCTKVHGEGFAERCVERVQENGFFSSVQRYFGLHYRADLMPEGNLEFLKLMEESGFNWFKEFKPEGT
ncbi:MAG: nitroreductase family protein [Candidatus Bathyarchaeota archaeon]|nr:MAG: nitroreductase family protein [Candidatus Bathyarchaeota archaeon]